jgi:hypothetical protein
VLQKLQACHLGKIQIDHDDVGQMRLVQVRERSKGFLAVLAALNSRRDAVRSNGFLQQKHVRIIIFDDKNLRGFA